jgi:hypothetical protein
MGRSFYLSIFITALVLTGLAYFLHFQNPAFQFWPLFIGNLLLASISIFSFSIIRKGLKSENPNALIRAKYTGTLIKFFIGIGALLSYFLIHGRHVYKPTIYLFLGMYIVYSALEAVPLSKLAKHK